MIANEAEDTSNPEAPEIQWLDLRSPAQMIVCTGVHRWRGTKIRSGAPRYSYIGTLSPTEGLARLLYLRVARREDATAAVP